MSLSGSSELCILSASESSCDTATASSSDDSDVCNSDITTSEQKRQRNNNSVPKCHNKKTTTGRRHSSRPSSVARSPSSDDVLQKFSGELRQTLNREIDKMLKKYANATTHDKQSGGNNAAAAADLFKTPRRTFAIAADRNNNNNDDNDDAAPADMRRASSESAVSVIAGRRQQMSSELGSSTELRRTAHLNSSPRRFSRSANSSPRRKHPQYNAASAITDSSIEYIAGNDKTVRNSNNKLLWLLGKHDIVQKPGTLPLDNNNNSSASSSGGGVQISPRQTFVLYASPRRIDLSRDPLHYRRLIGGGGTALVYEADLHGLVLAAKVYNEHFYDDAQHDAEKRRMLLKLNAISALPDHANVLRVYGYRLECDSRLIVLSERLDGSLRELIEERRTLYYGGDKLAKPLDVLAEPPFSLQEVIALFAQVVAGLQFLHSVPEKRPPGPSAGNDAVVAVWHRDLKSENILYVRTECTPDSVLSDSCSSPRPTRGSPLHTRVQLKLADFDEAHIVYAAAGDSGATTTGARSRRGSSLFDSARKSLFRGSTSSPRLERRTPNIGTLQYRAPETITQKSDDAAPAYDERVDIWSVGMILYELLTLELPYARDENKHTWFELSGVIQSGQRPSLPSGYLSKRSWQPVCQIFSDCTQLDAAQRPTAATLLARLDSLQAK